MTLLDSFAVLALLKGEPSAATVRGLIDAGASLTTLGVAEVVDHLVRLLRVDPRSAVADIAQLRLGPSVVVDGSLAVAAARFRARRYHRSRSPLSLTDCVAAEAARANAWPLATADRALLDACRADGVAVVALVPA